MSDIPILQKKDFPSGFSDVAYMPEQVKQNLPTIKNLKTQLEEASKLVDDIILKKYLHKLTDFEIIPLSNEFKQKMYVTWIEHIKKKGVI